ncbi:DUF1097 domain-containing protein [Umezawaea endophytica]|uniref:DUF1097 domain-containing protein n=1 Tax=Umezawaea endophytica TaxID=1654476 RepID=A0A9X3AFA6_9PSEU|nr:DUF1097 domain-containing protein [Umezawaea endophytica]MCS7476955.1 DUF1097 domain-containing protein [Umezawaea endophytica]
MRALIATGITVGLLAGSWTWVSGQVGLPTWVAVVSWAAFFAAGGKMTGVVKTAAAGLSGVVWGWLAVLGAGALGGWVGALPVTVAVVAFAMCAQAGWQPLSFIPAAFLGAASLFGNDVNVASTAIAFVIGIVLGVVSEWSAGEIARRGAGRSSAQA